MIEHKFKLKDFDIRYIQSLLNLINLIFEIKIRIVWLKYEKNETAESRFIRDMNKFECMIQTYEYEQRTFEVKNFKEFQKLSLKIKSFERRT